MIERLHLPEFRSPLLASFASLCVRNNPGSVHQEIVDLQLTISQELSFQELAQDL